MIALLDPCLFLRPFGEAQEGPLDAEEEEAFLGELTDLLQACRGAGVRVSAAEGYWDALWEEIIVPLQGRLRRRESRSALEELRRSGVRRSLPEAPTGVRLWGFRQLFGAAPQGEAWVERLAGVAARLAATGEPLILLTRLIDGRNAEPRTGKRHVEIREITRWRVSVRLPQAAASVHLPCVRTEEQLSRPWSARYDARLPVQRDGGRYPFCMPARWAWRRTEAVRTVESAPAWVDQAGRGWTHPDIPGGRGYHWDVFFDDPALVAQIGLSQLNIVAWGGPPGEGCPGEIHHIPQKKKSKINNVEIGWSCP